MQYLERGRDRRTDPKLVFPEAQSILCVALPYKRTPPQPNDPTRGPQYARYLQGRDYHLDIKERLERVMSRVSRDFPEIQWKTCVDTSAVLERSWAALAGLGWIGKNTLLIHPKYGSYLFLGAVLISQKTGQGPKPAPNFCGHCMRCLNACPTQAFPQAGTLNSNRCISYWTLEKRGALDVSESNQKAIGSWIAGCDICQEVCPFNIKPVKEEMRTEQALPSSHDPTRLNDWLELIRETPVQYMARSKNTALERIKPAQFSRNLAITLKNSLCAITPERLAQLEDPIRTKAHLESDPVAKEEWLSCLSALDKLSQPVP